MCVFLGIKAAAWSQFLDWGSPFSNPSFCNQVKCSMVPQKQKRKHVCVNTQI